MWSAAWCNLYYNTLCYFAGDEELPYVFINGNEGVAQHLLQ